MIKHLLLTPDKMLILYLQVFRVYQGGEVMGTSIIPICPKKNSQSPSGKIEKRYSVSIHEI